MKKYVILASLASALVFTANAGNTAPANGATETVAPAKARTYKVDVTNSNLKWHGKKVTGEHMGNIGLKSGEMLVDGNKITGGTFVIDMNAMTCTDIKDANYNAKLVEHLKSDDFFSTDKHPTATFTITSIKPIANAKANKPNATVTGNLTVKGITNTVTFPATLAVKNGVATAKADVTIDRAKYDVRYNSNSFFGNLGDKAIMDDFVVSLNVSAKQ